MGWFDSDSLGWADIAFLPYGATHLAGIYGKKAVDASGITGGSDTPPAYNPDPNNFSYGLGKYTDANGVVHPTPEELAAAQQTQKQQLTAYDEKLEDLRSQSIQAGKSGNFALVNQLEAEIKATQQQRDQTNAPIEQGQDNYAAQRTRETVAKQGELAGLQQGYQARADEAYGRDAPQMGAVASHGQDYLTEKGGREAQQRQLAALEAYAGAPEGPSAAQAQLQAGTDMAARQQSAMARSQPGGGGAALRNAAFNTAGLQGNSANQAAMLRAQETEAYKQRQLAALNSASSAATGLRSGDQSFAGMQANQANTDANLAFNTNQQNLQAQLASRQQNDATALGYGQLGLGTLGASQQYDAQRDALAGNQSAVGTNFEAAKAASAGAQFQAQQAQQAQQNRNQEMLLGIGAGAAGWAAGGPGGAAAASKAVSDERAKKNVSREKALSAALETVGNAPGYSYDYKDPSQPGAKPGRQYGPMAQDLERGPLGHTLVKDTPTGKVVDTGRVAMMGASAITELNHRLEALESALGKKKVA